MSKTIRYAILSVAVSVIVHFRWFVGFGYLAEGDWPVRFPEGVVDMLAWPQAWQPGGFGQFFLSSAFYYMEVVNAALSSLGLGFNVVERLEYLWPIAVLTPLGAFLLIKKLVRSDEAAFIGSLAWTYNVYFFVKQQSHIYIMLASALLPFAVLAYLHCIRTRTIRSVIVAGLACFAVSAADFRIFYFLAFILAALALADAASRREWLRLRELFRSACFAGAPIVIALLLNAYWIIGFSSTGAISSNSILDRGLFGNQLVSTADSLALFRGDWTDGKPLVFGQHPVIWRYWWLPLAALSGLWVRRRERDAVFFALVAMAGVFLSKQSDAPFRETYSWLFENFPGFKAYRESSKFFVIQALGYGVLVGYLAAWLLEHRATGARWKMWARNAVLVLLVALPLSNAKPLLTGEIGAIFVPRELRPEYLVWNDHLRSQPDFFRVVSVPRGSMWALRGPLHPAISSEELRGERLSAYKGASQLPYEGPESFLAPFALPEMDGILDRLAVRYVTVPPHNGQNNDDALALFGLQYQDVTAALDKVPYLRRVDLGTGDLAVYENADARPHVYATAGDDTAMDEPPLPAEDHLVDMSRREVRVPNVRAPFTLHFSESYHPGWTLLPKLPSRIAALGALREPVPGVTHAPNAVSGNAFRIDPAEACRVLTCVTASDGSLTVEAVLFFAPQAYFDLGSMLTAATMIACLATLAVLTVRARRQRRTAAV